jgi:AraC-like DNA-binding protein
MYRKHDIPDAALLARHETTTRPVSALAADYPNGMSTGEHVHARAQLLYAIEGVMIVRSEAGYWVVPPSRGVWLIPGVSHEVRMCGDVKMRTVFVASDAVPDLPASSSVLAVGSLLREHILAATSVPLDYTMGSRDDRVMQLLLDELKSLSVLPLHLPRPKDSRLRHICDTLAERPDLDLSVDQWGARLKVAGRTIQRLFRRETGLTFGQWRQQARLLFALERLARGDRIIDVALDSGYASQSAFAAMFRRHFGVPPSCFYG